MLEIFETKPEKFNCDLQVAACYLEVKGRILLLKRKSHKSDPGLWGLPAGKFEKNETPLQAALRELSEETGVVLDSSQITPFDVLYIRRTGEYVYHMFSARLLEFPKIRLCEEHEEAHWVLLDHVESMPLIPGGKEAFRKYLKHREETRSDLKNWFSANAQTLASEPY